MGTLSREMHLGTVFKSVRTCVPFFAGLITISNRKKEEARAKGQVTSEEKSDQTFPSVPKQPTETNNNWIAKLAKEAHSGDHSKNVVNKTQILPGMEGSGDIIGGIMSAMWPSMTKMIEGEILKEVEGAINISVKYVPAVNL